MTIGYGAPMDDIFYGGCSSIASLLTLEVSRVVDFHIQELSDFGLS